MRAGNEAGFFDGELLSEFAPTATEAWHRKLADDLGEDWRDRLRWNAGEGLTLLPFYRTEDLGEEVPTGAPGMRTGWRIRHDLAAADPGEAESEVKAALQEGAEALGLPARFLEDAEALREVLASVDLSETALHLEALPAQAQRFIEWIHSTSTSDDTVEGSLCFDPSGRLLSASDFDAEAGYRQLATLLQDFVALAPDFRLVTADARPYHQAGAGAVESLAFALASLSEHFARLAEEDVDPASIATHAQVMLPVGTRFFVEVARLRAMRRLFVQLAEAYGVADAPRLHVQAVTAWRSTTMYDPHVNLLRGGTAGAAAAVVGGADVLSVRPFDAALQEQSAFGRRLALNAQHILREEAHLGRVADPAAGSYYAEVFTDRLARRVWERFQEIESEGGLLTQIRAGVLEARLDEARTRRDEALSRRRRVRIGTNHYPNLDEERLDDEPASDRAPRETEAFEQVRLLTERHGRLHGRQRPTVFLLPVGTPKVRSTRANFVRNALGCAAFSMVENVGFSSAEAGARAAAEAVRVGEAQLIACCAPDENYPLLLSVLRETLDDPDVPLVVAGRPDVLPDGAPHAVDAFVYRGMDLLPTLELLQRRLGLSGRP